MQAPDSNPSGFKWWIAALSDQHLFTLWGKGQLEQGKTIAYNSFEANRKYGEKLEEKREKGYIAIAKYSNSKKWRPETAMPVPAYPPMPKGTGGKVHEEELMLTLMLEGNGINISLNLNGITGQPAGSQTSGLMRLDHYESRNVSSMLGFPLWQTRFDGEQDAVDVIKSVIDDRQGKGYTLMKLSGASRLRDAILNGTPLPQFTELTTNILNITVNTGTNAPESWFW